MGGFRKRGELVSIKAPNGTIGGFLDCEDIGKVVLIDKTAEVGEPSVLVEFNLIIRSRGTRKYWCFDDDTILIKGVNEMRW